jgi:Leucine-rich repeat (LRR) protein
LCSLPVGWELQYELTEVPGSLGNMGINKLQLANNNLNQLPDGVWGNDNIFHLELDNNNISEISASIKNATSLSHFFCCNNSIAELRNDNPIYLSIINTDR